MLVWIVYLPDAELRGPDLTRMNRVEEVPDELGRAWLNDGSARRPTDDEVAAFEEQRTVEAKADEAQAQGDLTKLLKDELLKLAADRGVEVDESMTKPAIVKAIEEHAAGQAGGGQEAGEPDSPAEVTPGARQDHSFNADTGA